MTEQSQIALYQGVNVEKAARYWIFKDKLNG